MNNQFKVSAKSSQVSLMKTIKFLVETGDYDKVKFTIARYRKIIEDFINTGYADSSYITKNTAAKAVNFLEDKVKYSPTAIEHTSLFKCKRFIISEVIFTNDKLEDVAFIKLMLDNRIYSTQYSKIKNVECLELIEKSIIENGVYYPILSVDVELMLYDNLPFDVMEIGVSKRLYSFVNYLYNNFGLDAVLFICDCFKSYDIIGSKLLQSPELRPYLLAAGYDYNINKSGPDLKPDNIENFIRSDPDNINLVPDSLITPELVKIYLEGVSDGAFVPNKVVKVIGEKEIDKHGKIFREMSDADEEKNKEIYNVPTHELNAKTLSRMIDCFDVLLWDMGIEDLQMGYERIIIKYLYGRDKYKTLHNLLDHLSNRGLICRN